MTKQGNAFVASERRGDQRALLRRLGGYLSESKALIASSFALATLATLATLYIPRALGRGVDALVGPGQVDFGSVKWCALRILASGLVAAISSFCATLLNARIAYGASRRIREDAFSSLTAAPLRELDGRSRGAVASAIVSDADQLADGLALGVAQFFTGIISIVGVLAFMLATDVRIALVVIALTPASLLVARVIASRSFSLFNRRSELRAQETGLVSETIEGRRSVKSFCLEERLSDSFERLDAELADATLKATFVSSLSNPATRFVNGVVYAAVGLVGALATISGLMTVGSLVVFLSYAEQYAKPFNEISSVATEFQNALASAGRLFKLIDLEPERDVAKTASSEVAAPILGRLEFESATFSYRPDQRLIENLNFTATPGMNVAIVGPTGCGKTTLVNLIMRFYELNSGRILLDGRDSREYSLDEWRAFFGMVLQESWLKRGTIRENILMGAPETSEEEFERIARACRVEAFARLLPKGYDTPVSDDGDELSQGQRQLICAARVMARKPRILILDEATSSIDTRAEMKIQEAFNELMIGRTSFVVAHRLSTIRNADVILAMKDGRIVESGSHEELLARGGFYRRLYYSQFANGGEPDEESDASADGS